MCIGKKGCRGGCRLVMVCLCALALAGGCENAGQGAVSGGAVGALSGLAIGSLSGNAGAGAAIGAVTGAVGGAVIGDQNRRNKEAAEAAAAQNAAAQSKPPRVYVTGGPLWLLVGNWNVQGEELATDGTRVPITGSVKGVVDKTYFLRLDCRFNNPRGDGFVEGTSVISQDGGDRLSMSNSFSSSPQMVRYTGNVDKSGLLFTFTQYEPRSDSPRKVTLRIISNDRISAEVWQRINGKDQRVESYTFTRAA